MTDVINVKFHPRGKVYFFNPAGHRLTKGTRVIVDTVKGLAYAVCSSMPYQIDEASLPSALRPVLRIATPQDDTLAESYHSAEKSAMRICKRKILEHGLDMKLIHADFSFDGGKLTFFFTADGRIDFRDLVKDLGAAFHKRIELRQIGIRDGARLLGGLGPCGRPFCCSTFQNDFQAISVKMAKTQSMSLNPTKISGTCGNLMCCLKYEEEAYDDLQKDAPLMESEVETPDGRGKVTEVNLLRRTARVQFELDGPSKPYPFEQLGYTMPGGDYHAAEAPPVISEKLPAFEPPTYSDLPVAEPRHERVREHNIPPRGNAKQNAQNVESSRVIRSSQRSTPQLAQRTPQSAQQGKKHTAPRRPKPHTPERTDAPAPFRKNNRRNTDDRAATGARPQNRKPKK